jgi:hypothetical protein
MNEKLASGALILASAFTLSSILVAAVPARAQSKFSDLICPNATEPVREFEFERRKQPPVIDRWIAAAKKAIAAYDQCALLKLTEGEAKVGLPNQTTQFSTDSGAERQHYANLRSAQYYVIVGRLHRFLERYDLAREADQTALELVKNTIEWQSASEVTYRSNNVNIGTGSVRKPSTTASFYRHDAIGIRDAALAELARLSALEDASGATSVPR